MTKTSRNGDQKGMAELPFTAWGENQWKTYNAETSGDYTGACLPFGLVRSMNSPDPIQIMQNKTYVSLLYEQNTWFKVIPVDGRPHRKQVATWFGDSVGKWDGDTLVVDTVNFNGRTRLDTIGHPNSDQLHVIEKFSRPDLGHMNYENYDRRSGTKPSLSRGLNTLASSRCGRTGKSWSTPARRTYQQSPWEGRNQGSQVRRRQVNYSTTGSASAGCLCGKPCGAARKYCTGHDSSAPNSSAA